MCSKKEQILLFLERIILMGEHDGWIVHNKHKKRCHKTSLFLWCAMRDLNPHGRPLDPKSSASANSANRAYPQIVKKESRGFGFLS